MSNPKNKGTKLFFSQFGGEQPIPPEFIAAMNRVEEIQAVPNDVTPENLSDTIVESKVETNRVNERVRRTIKKTAGNIGPLHFIHVNEQGKPVQASRTLIPTAYAIANPSIPTATSTPADQDLGNGWTIREVAVEGTYVAGVFTEGVFSGNVFERERPNLTPEEFRPTIPTVTTRVDSAGTAVDPTLSGTELSERQEQITDLKKRITISTQTAPSLPVTLDKGRDTNQAKQSVTVTRKLIADGTSADTPTALKDVAVKQLGDGNKVQETREIASVFIGTEFTDKSPAYPPEYVTGETTESFTEASDEVADVIAPAGGSQTQHLETAFTRRTTTTTPTTSSPITEVVTNQEKQKVTIVRTLGGTAGTPTATVDVEQRVLPGGRTEGVTKTVASVFDATVFAKQRQDAVPERFKKATPEITEKHLTAGTASAPSLSSGDVAKSEQQKDAFVKETSVTNKAVGGYPSLSGQTYDEQLNAVITYAETIGSAGANIGNNYIDVTPLGTDIYGNGVDLNKEIDVSALATTLDAYLAEFPGTTNLVLPDILESVEIIWNEASGEGSFDSEWTGWVSGTSGSLGGSEAGNAQGSASAMPELSIRIKQTWAKNLATTRSFFFLPLPISIADILGKVGAIATWPVFRPKAHTIVLHGMKVAVDAKAQGAASVAFSDSSSSWDRSEGSGTSEDVNSMVSAVNIPPTIHGDISFSDVDRDVEATATATADWDGYNFPSINASASASKFAHAFVYPEGVDATTPSVIPTSGIYLIDSHVEIYGYGYGKCYAETLDAAVLA